MTRGHESSFARRAFGVGLAALVVLFGGVMNQPAYAQGVGDEPPGNETPRDGTPRDGTEDGEPSPALQRAREAFRDALESIWVPRYRLTNGSYVREAFRDVVADASSATVRVRNEGRTLALGGIVGPDGWILTKASQLKGAVTVLLKDKREFDARVVGVDRDHDVAMLKIDAKGLPSLALSDDAGIDPGGWVATPGHRREPLAVGVVSVKARKIRHRAGILGIQMDDSADADKRGDGALVVKVFTDSGAERAGILVNDLVIRVGDQKIRSREELKKEIVRHSPGDEIEIEVQRGKQRVIVRPVLTGRVQEMFGPQSRSEYQNSLGSVLSRRRRGFPTALQHDTVLKPTECGGPLVDLDGRVVGFNIARAGRTESYAIPTEAILPLMYKLMSGQQAPEDEG